jgi:hypothetical protein
MMIDDVFIHLVNLPVCIRAYTRPNADGSFSVFINARLSHNIQQSAKAHELSHIELGDYDRLGVIVDMLEATRHQ